jgi:hypothetical protein
MHYYFYGFGSGVFAIVGVLLGRFSPVRGKNLCGCKHPLGSHDLRTGACNDMRIAKANDGSGRWGKGQEVPCRCLHYVGPSQAEPLEFGEVHEIHAVKD